MKGKKEFRKIRPLLCLLLAAVLICGTVWNEPSFASGNETEQETEGLSEAEPASEPDSEALGSIETEALESTEAEPAGNPEPEACANSVSGSLWLDMFDDVDNGIYAGDGTRQPEESPLPGYTVELFKADDLESAVATAETDADGTYSFTNIDPGSYVVGVKTETIDGIEYLLPFYYLDGTEGDNRFVTTQEDPDDEESPYLYAYTAPIEIDADTAVGDMDAGMRTVPEIQPMWAIFQYGPGVSNLSATSATVSGIVRIYNEWNPGANGGQGGEVADYLSYADFYIKRSTDTTYPATATYRQNIGVFSTTSTEVSHTFTGLTAGTTYNVRMVLRLDNSTMTETVTFTTPLPPTVSAPTVSSITSTTAALTGTFNLNGNALSGGSFYYGTSASPTTAKAWSSSTTTSAAGSLTGLTPNTRYYVRNYVANVYSTDTSFVTSPATPSISASGTSASAGSITGAISYAGNQGYNVTVIYSTSATFASGNVTVVNATSGTSWTAAPSGLLADTTYYVRITMTNTSSGITNAGASATATTSFKTLRDITVDFDSDGGTAVSSKTYTSFSSTTTFGTLTSPTRTGYDFLGWYTGTNGAGTQVTSAKTISSVFPTGTTGTLYAKWTPKSYTMTVNYRTRSGSSVVTGATNFTATAAYDSVYALTSAQTAAPSGYIYLGHCIGSDTAILPGDPSFTVAGNTTVNLVYGIDTNGNGVEEFAVTKKFVSDSGKTIKATETAYLDVGSHFADDEQYAFGNPNVGYHYAGYNLDGDTTTLHAGAPNVEIGPLSVPDVLESFDHTVTYVYDEVRFDVKITYVDALGNELSEQFSPRIKNMLEGDDYTIMAKDVQGYRIIYYTVDTDPANTHFDLATAPMQPVTADMEIKVVYASTTMSVSVPVKLLWAAFDGGGGSIESPEYQIINNSYFSVDVGAKLTNVNYYDPDGTTVVAAPAADKELSLDLTGSTANGVTALNTSTSLLFGESAYRNLGTLGAKVTGGFTIGGSYFGTIPTNASQALYPEYGMEFKFSINIPGVGGQVIMGKDKNGDDIVWRVIATDTANNKILVISEQILDRREFHNVYGNPYPTWGASAIRGYLNGTFITNTFTTAEQTRILLTTGIQTETAWNNATMLTTSDKVFLLSTNEVNTYFSSVTDRISTDLPGLPPGDYSAMGGTGWYWLRSPTTLGAIGSVSAGAILADGSLYSHRATHLGGVRPAMWISTDY